MRQKFVAFALLFFCLKAFAQRSASTTHVIPTPTGGLKKNDLIEWSGYTNTARLPCVLVLRAKHKSSFYSNRKRTYSLLRMTMMAAKHVLIIKNGPTGNEWSARPFCPLGRARLSRGTKFQIIIRIHTISIMIYYNGALTYVLPITRRLPSIGETNHIAVYNSQRTEHFRLLTDQDLGSKLQEESCGEANTDIPVPAFCPEVKDGLRIVEGVNANPGSQPWQVSIRKKYPLRGRTPHSCGGTLINRCYVLTAAHCVESSSKSFTNETIVRVGDYYNRDGLQFSQSEGVEDSRDLDIEEVYRHPYYSYHSSPTNDLALIKLRQCVSFNRFVRPACLPLGQNQFSSQSRCGISGWGAHGPRHFNPMDYPPCLQQAPVSIFPNENCSRLLGVDYLKHSMMCAAKDGTDTCRGDSGGPLACLDTNTTRHTIWGITSWGIGCGNVNKPGIYTRVSSYVRWLYLKMRLRPTDEQFMSDVRSFRVLDKYCQHY